MPLKLSAVAPTDVLGTTIPANTHEIKIYSWGAHLKAHKVPCLFNCYDAAGAKVGEGSLWLNGVAYEEAQERAAAYLESVKDAGPITKDTYRAATAIGLYREIEEKLGLDPGIIS